MVLGYDLSLSVSLVTLPRPFQVLKKRATKNQNVFYKFILHVIQLKDYAKFSLTMNGFAMHSERGKQPESVLIILTRISYRRVPLQQYNCIWPYFWIFRHALAGLPEVSVDPSI